MAASHESSRQKEKGRGMAALWEILFYFQDTKLREETGQLFWRVSAMESSRLTLVKRLKLDLPGGRAARERARCGPPEGSLVHGKVQVRRKLAFARVRRRSCAWKVRRNAL